MRWRIKKGDEVVIITGGSKGHRGEVLSVLRKEEKVLVKGANIKARHTKPSAQHPEGGIIRKEAPLHVSNVMIVDPGASKEDFEKGKGGTRVGVRRTSDGKRERFSKRSGKKV